MAGACRHSGPRAAARYRASGNGEPAGPVNSTGTTVTRCARLPSGRRAADSTTPDSARAVNGSAAPATAVTRAPAVVGWPGGGPGSTP
jgi:hypothetical protein